MVIETDKLKNLTSLHVGSFAFIILTSSLQNPNSPVAVWASIIPFTSPIVMMGRIPFGVPDTVPYWQLISSMVCLIGGFLFTTWFAGKVYRTGILMYGKKILLERNDAVGV